MATFVLVTGAWHGSWCWKRVRAALTADGHAVWVDDQCTDQPLASFQQKLHLDHTAPAVGSIHYIYASGWEGTPFTSFYESAKARGWSTREIACGHDVMLDKPEELTAALLLAAAN